MATQTYDLLASTTLTSATNNVTFSAISQSYGDLILVVESAGAAGNVSMRLRLNLDSDSNYKSANMKTNDAADLASLWETPLTEANLSGGYLVQETAPGITRVQIMEYTATDKYKSILHTFDQANNGIARGTSRWVSTSAVNSVSILGSNNLRIGSTFKLYGVVK